MYLRICESFKSAKKKKIYCLQIGGFAICRTYLRIAHLCCCKWQHLWYIDVKIIEFSLVTGKN
jgi:hypothetical protein